LLADSVVDRGGGVVVVDAFLDDQASNHRAGSADERQPEPPPWLIRLSHPAQRSSVGADNLDDQGVGALAFTGGDEAVEYECGVRARADLVRQVAMCRGEALDIERASYL
jgi:hypothetical protein